MSDLEKLAGVSKAVVEDFLDALQKKEVEAELIERLRNALLTNEKISDQNIKKALFPDG